MKICYTCSCHPPSILNFKDHEYGFIASFRSELEANILNNLVKVWITY